jgi:hypothetical protein
MNVVVQIPNDSIIQDILNQLDKVVAHKLQEVIMKRFELIVVLIH